MNKILPCSMIVLLFACVSVTARGADEWPQFRGPDGQGHSSAKGLPLKWSESEHVTWKTQLPGKGHSSPVISGNRIWLTAAVVVPLTKSEEEQRLAKIKNSRGLRIAGRLSLKAICIDRTNGKQLHDIELFSVNEPEPIHSLNSYASPTPVINGGRLYCHFGTYGTACLDAETGNLIWSNHELKTDHQNGPGSSPILWKNLLLAHFDGIDRQYVIALNKNSGKLVWRQDRSGKMNDRPEFQKAYCTPLIVEDDRRAQLISPAADWVYSYNPATGEELWKAHYGKLGFSTVPRPVAGHGMVYICTSFMQSRMLAVRYDGTGDVTKSHIKWQSDRQIPKKPSTLLIGGKLYFVSDGGILSCLDAETGEEHWRERMEGEYSASPIYADGRIYLFNHEGQTTVIAPGKKFQRLSINQLDGAFMASPAVAGKALFLRTDSHLYRIEK